MNATNTWHAQPSSIAAKAWTQAANSSKHSSMKHHWEIQRKQHQWEQVIAPSNLVDTKRNCEITAAKEAQGGTTKTTTPAIAPTSIQGRQQ
jgi:hypothetical protein